MDLFELWSARTFAFAGICAFFSSKSPECVFCCCCGYCCCCCCCFCLALVDDALAPPHAHVEGLPALSIGGPPHTVMESAEAIAFYSEVLVKNLFDKFYFNIIN